MNVLFPNEQIIETTFFVVAQDWEVPIPAFFVISAKRKVTSLTEFSDEEATEFILLTKKIRQGMRDALNIGVVYIFQNEDSSHNFHLWMFPRHSWMDSFGAKIQSVRPIMEYAVKTMSTDVVFGEVKNSVDEMRRYLGTAFEK